MEDFVKIFFDWQNVTFGDSNFTILNEVLGA